MGQVKKAMMVRELTLIEEALDQLEKASSMIADALNDLESVGVIGPNDLEIPAALEANIEHAANAAADRKMILGLED